jgi:quercetin dioxygenase-like cupin family protein
MPQVRSSRILLAGALAFMSVAAAAEPVRSDHPGLQTLLSTGTTVTDEPIHYPTAAPARVTVVEITLLPGEQTGWHAHPVPLIGYILEGELTVDYGPLGQRTYHRGEALAEAMNEAHNGRNSGDGPVRILAVFIGAEGVAGTVPAPPPPRRQ